MFTKPFPLPSTSLFLPTTPREGPPWAACQRCHPGLLKWLPARREQLYPRTNSKQMAVRDEECQSRHQAFVLGCSLCFLGTEVMLPVWCPPCSRGLAAHCIGPIGTWSLTQILDRRSDSCWLMTGTLPGLPADLFSIHGPAFKRNCRKPFWVLLLKHNPSTQEIRLASRVRNPRIMFHSCAFYLWSVSLCCLFPFSTPFSLP